MGFIYGLMAAHPWLLQVVAQTKGKATPKASGFQAYGMWILILVMVVVFYFLLIRPQRKRAQEHDEMVNKVERGDEVVTIGGIHGVVRRQTEDTVVLEVDKGVKVTFSKSAIAKRVTQPEEEEEKEEAEPEEKAEEEANGTTEEETQTDTEEEE